MRHPNYYLSRWFNFEVIRKFPRESIKFARSWFGFKKIIVVEVGVLWGENAVSMNKELNISKLYLIDPFINYEGYKDDYGVEKAELIAHEKNNKGNEIWIKKFSDKAIKDIHEKPDLIYIDGNHTYQYVKKDLEMYWEILNKNGIICGDDIQDDDVSGAVLDFARENKLKIHFGDRRDWWMIKEIGEEKGKCLKK